MSRLTWRETIRLKLPTWDLMADDEPTRYWVRQESRSDTPDPRKPFVVMRQFWKSGWRLSSHATLAEAQAAAIEEYGHE